MKRGIRALGVVVLLAAAAGAAWRWWPRAAVPQGPRLELAWKGALNGSASLPVEITWCPGKQIGLIEAVSHDTGFLAVLHEGDELAAVPHPVFIPEMTGVPKPWAHAAFRAVRDTNPPIIERYVSQNGKFELTGSATQLAGTFQMVMRWPGRPDTIAVTGRFGPTPAVARTAGCD